MISLLKDERAHDSSSLNAIRLYTNNVFLQQEAVYTKSEVNESEK